MIIQVPVTTEVLEKIDDLKHDGKVENNQILIQKDTRSRDYHKLFGLSRKTKIGWSNEPPRVLRRLKNLSAGGYVTPQIDDYQYDPLNRIQQVSESQQSSSGQVSFLFTQKYAYDR